jgi:hypothetical protein
MEQEYYQSVNNLIGKMGHVESKLVSIEASLKDNTHKTERTLDQALKTNGRVDRTEEFMKEQLKINSKLDGMYMNMLDRMERESKQRDRDDKETFINRDQFDPIKKIVYGVVGLILSGVMAGIMALVLK